MNWGKFPLEYFLTLRDRNDEMTNNQEKAFIFDLDGTLYIGDEAIPGAKETLEWVRSQGSKVRFVTNNPRFSSEFYSKKLNDLGIPATEEEIVTSAKFTAEYLKSHSKFGEIFILGEDQLRQELLSAGLTVVDTDPDTVIVSFDTTLTYEKLMVAYRALRKGAHFIATNPDVVCPTPDGGLMDAGATIAALEASTGRKNEAVIGKPSKLLAELLVKELDVSAENCVIVGDRLNTDIRLGKQIGMKTVWIRAFDEALPESIEEQPDHIINSIAELPEIL